MATPSLHPRWMGWKFWKKSEEPKPAESESFKGKTIIDVDSNDTSPSSTASSSSTSPMTPPNGKIDPDLYAKFTDLTFHHRIMDVLAASGQLSNPQLATMCAQPDAPAKMISVLSMFSGVLSNQLAKETKKAANLGAFNGSLTPNGIKQIQDPEIIGLLLKDEKIMRPILTSFVDRVKVEIAKKGN